jgi:hypothetical protein
MLVCLHVAAVAALLRVMALTEAAAIVGAGDLVLAGVASFFAARNVPCAQERAALALRQEAIGAVQREFAWVSLLPTLITMVRRFL